MTGFTPEQLDAMAKKYPQLVEQLVLDMETSEEQQELDVDTEEKTSDEVFLGYGLAHDHQKQQNDDEIEDYEYDDYYDEDDEDEEDYDDDYDDSHEYDYDDHEPSYQAVSSVTTSRISIYVNDMTFAFNITEVPASIAHIVKRLIKPSCDTDMYVLQSEIQALTAARMPRLTKFITQVSGGDIKIENNQVTLDGQEINANNIETLLAFAEDNNVPGIKQFVRFQRSLENNTSARVINRLYDFLKCSSIDIDDTGNIIAYKAVRSDLYDCHTGSTYLNSEGAVIEMPRNRVDDDDHSTCSFGLHVCSINYLKGFYWTDNKRLAIVKIKPEDFVSIPVDYNDAKARVCKYTVEKICSIDEAEELLGRSFNIESDSDDENDVLENMDLSDFL